MQKIIPVESCDFVVFGGTGDLSLRKLLPSLYFRDQDRQITEDTRIVLASRAEATTEEIVTRVHDALQTHIPAAEFSDAVWQRFAKRLVYVSIEAAAKRGWAALQAVLAPRAAEIR